MIGTLKNYVFLIMSTVTAWIIANTAFLLSYPVISVLLSILAEPVKGNRVCPFWIVNWVGFANSNSYWFPFTTFILKHDCSFPSNCFLSMKIRGWGFPPETLHGRGLYTSEDFRKNFSTGRGTWNTCKLSPPITCRTSNCRWKSSTYSIDGFGSQDQE